ncbi:MAG: PDC sensor domain-containing protein, partial [Methanoregulaceae archaeon]|nr:PDC sensor domain-containing protein [Methanoregulaceae archaeon]
MKGPVTGSPERWIVIAVVVVLVAGMLLSSIAVQVRDRSMREDLLITTRLSAAGVPLGNIENLTATENDLRSPEYGALKTLMVDLHSSDPHTRFVYLMGRNPEGEVFFFIDSELPDSKDYSPPGQVYSEATESTHLVFTSGLESTIGPVTDRWGTWVSGLVPLRDSGTGEIIAVLGMDVDAGDWNSQLAAA